MESPANWTLTGIIFLSFKSDPWEDPESVKLVSGGLGRSSTQPVFLILSSFFLNH